MSDDPASNDNNPVASLISEGLNAPTTYDPSADDDFPGPFATMHDVVQCQLSSWYPTFAKPFDQDGRKRNRLTITTVTLKQLPSDFTDYLLSDGVELPKDATKLSSCANVGNDDWSSDEEEGGNQQVTEEESDAKKFHFPELNQRITTAIESLGGAVIPKLNWSSPKDATWVNEGSLKCKTPGDIYLLIKSSDFCLHDVLRNTWKECSDYDRNNDSAAPELELTLRKWCNLFPSMEFRCFVRQHELGM